MNGLDRFEALMKERLPVFRLMRRAMMKDMTSLRVGGPADLLAEPATEEELGALIAAARACELPVTLMGNGSNLLVRDGGIRGLVIRLGRRFADIRVTDGGLEARSGVLLSELSQEAMRHGLSGLEFASGIPGTLGGAVYMNAGAYGGEMRDVITSVRVLRDGQFVTLGPDALDLRYRHSSLMNEGGTVVWASLALKRDDTGAIAGRMAELAARRRDKQPLSLPSAGSFFKRPLNGYAAQLIEEAGLKGLTVGGAQVSQKHAGFLVNAGGATARDFLALMDEVRQRVYLTSGVMLEPEVRILGEDE